MGSAGLAVGLGRSYGDVGLAANGCVLDTSGMSRVLAFDSEQGILRCEGGVQLGELLATTLPAGWMLPVVPGTRFVTVAGAIANDIHGKNHHRAGSFGCHVRELLIRRSSGEEIRCSPARSPEWFEATIGGLGLTGVILEVELTLMPVSGPFMATETIKFQGLDAFFALSEESDAAWDYTVAWIECAHPGARGHFSRARHSDEPGRARIAKPLLGVPFTPPVSPINRLTLKLFNSLYYHRQLPTRRSARRQLAPWFFPLDGVAHWNRLYGRRGFRQYQCVVAPPAVAELLARVRRSRQVPGLSVLKLFGDRRSPGLISFPRPGATLAMDFPWRGAATIELFSQLDEVVRDCEGAIYPAKDAHMSAADFRRAYPRWETLERLRDPALLSLFWQRTAEVSA